MQKLVSIGFLTAGMILLILGIEDYQAALPQTMGIAPTDRTVWLLIGGLLALITAFFRFSDQKELTS